MVNRRLLFGIGALSLLVLLFFLARQIWVPKRQMDEGADALAFFPSTVQKFTWKVGDHSFEYLRNKKNPIQWSPATDPQNVEARLLALATSWGKAFTAASAPQVEVTLNFADGSVWDGYWDGKNFQWTSGPKSGEGARLNSEQSALFQAGKLAFEQRKYRLCLDRIDGFRLHKDEKTDFEVQRSLGQWTANKNGKTANLDASFFESWLAQNCEAIAEHNVDVDLIKELPKSFAAVEFQTNPDKFVTVELFDSGLLKISDRYLISKRWAGQWGEFENRTNQALREAK